MSGFKPGDIVIRQLKGGYRSNSPRWGVYIRDAKRYDQFGYVLFFSRTHPAFNETPSSSNHVNLIPLIEATERQLRVVPSDVHAFARNLMAKQHPTLYKEVFREEPPMTTTDEKEIRLIEAFQDAQKRVNLYRVFRNEDKNDLADLLANGALSVDRALILHKLEDANDDWLRANKIATELWDVVKKYQDELKANAIAEGLEEAPKPQPERKHDVVRMEDVELPEVNEGGIIRQPKMVKYHCKCGFVGKATAAWHSEDLGRKAWKNFYAHQHRQEVRAMREEKANAGS